MCAFEARLRSTNGPQERVTRFLPGLVPSGWQRVTRLVRTDHGTRAMAFSGFGLSVVAEVYENYATITVRRPDGDLTVEDIDHVRGLYRRSPLRHRMDASARRRGVAIFRFVE